MAEYYASEAVLDFIRSYQHSTDVAFHMEEHIDEIPAADVRPVVKAQILDMRYVEEDGEWKCSCCGWQYTLCVCGKDVTSKIHYCPNCGAMMEES